MKTVKDLKIELEKINHKLIKVNNTGWSYRVYYINTYGDKCEKSHILGVKNWIGNIFNEIKNEI